MPEEKSRWMRFKEWTKEFLRPTKKKFVTAGIFFVVLVLFYVLLLVANDAFNLTRAIERSTNTSALFIPIYVIIGVFLLEPFFLPFIAVLPAMIASAYLFACFKENKSMLRSIIYTMLSLTVLCFVFAAIIFSLTIPVDKGINTYNKAYGYSCTADSDCKIYECGAHSNKFITIKSSNLLIAWKDVGAHYDSLREAFCMEQIPLCENNRCIGIPIRMINSTTYCDRINEEYLKNKCIAAVTANNRSRRIVGVQ